MSDTSSGSPRSSAKSGAKPGAKPPTKKNAGRQNALARKGVLANLPRTRPQRSSARRDAARRAASVKAQSSPAPKPVAAEQPPAKAKAKPRTKAKAAAKRAQDPVPRQGFETEGDPVSGPVQPPGSVDLLSSAAELAGELTKSGLASGGRLLKDFIGRLPLN